MYGAILGDMIGAPYEFSVENTEQIFLLFPVEVFSCEDPLTEVFIRNGIRVDHKTCSFQCDRIGIHWVFPAKYRVFRGYDMAIWNPWHGCKKRTVSGYLGTDRFS